MRNHVNKILLIEYDALVYVVTQIEADSTHQMPFFLEKIISIGLLTLYGT